MNQNRTPSSKIHTHILFITSHPFLQRLLSIIGELFKHDDVLLIIILQHTKFIFLRFKKNKLREIATQKNKKMYISLIEKKNKNTAMRDHAAGVTGRADGSRVLVRRLGKRSVK